VRVEVLPAGRNQDDVARVFGVHTLLPSQLPRPRPHPGIRALYAELLREALRDAGVVRGIAPLQPRRQALATAWLTGALDAEVLVPIRLVCDVLDLDAGVLAAAVRARATQ
jgi:hypothetical protein